MVVRSYSPITGADGGTWRSMARGYPVIGLQQKAGGGGDLAEHGKTVADCAPKTKPSPAPVRATLAPPYGLRT